MDCHKTNGMKKIITVLMILTITGLRLPAYAQSRFETMMNQVAGLETYLTSMKSVYRTTSNGLNTINNLKTGSFSLNQNYFNSLKNVSPAVKNNPKIKAIGDLQQQIQAAFNNALSWQQNKGALTNDEISYMKSVYSSLLTECGTDLTELNMVITNGQVQMTDDQRIRKIDQLYTDMQQKYSFSQSFTGKAYGLANSRINDKSSKQTLQTLYNPN
jgi:hypothetical protein